MQPVNDFNSEEALLLFHYGELSPAEMQAYRESLANDAGLAQRYAELVEFLSEIEDPHSDSRPDDFYSRRMRERVLRELPARPRTLKWQWLGGGIAAAAVMALAMVLAFQLGRGSVGPASDATLQADGASTELQARLLNASLVQHLESSSRFLRQVDNASVATVDIESERRWAATLLVANRLYRFAAEQAGQHRVATVLQDMEPILIEMANGEGELSDAEFARLRERIQSRDLLFKVDVTGNALAPNRERRDSI